MEILSANIQKGGCGKTTTIQAIAEIAGSQKKKVLCIDMDPQCNLTTAAGVDIMETQNNNVYTLLKGLTSFEESIVSTKYFDVIPGSLLLTYADTEFNRTGKEYFLKERIEEAEGKYDIVLIDTPPALNLLNIMTLTASTKIIVSSEVSFFALVGLNQLYETIETVKKYSNKDLEFIGILPIKYKKNQNLSHEVIKSMNELAKSMNAKVFKSKIRESVKIREAQTQMIPIIEWCKGNIALEDYTNFYKELKKSVKGL